MKIEFNNEKMEKLHLDPNKMQKKVGAKMAKSYYKRYNELKSMVSIRELLDSQFDRPHFLKRGNKQNTQIAWDVSANYRLILELSFVMDEEKYASLNQIYEVKIMGVEDYHGEKQNWIFN